jgi:hypothetical protein
VRDFDEQAAAAATAAPARNLRREIGAPANDMILDRQY